MTAIRQRGERIRKFIFSQLDRHPKDVVRVTAEAFGASRQAIHKHIRRLVAEGAVLEEGATRNKTYRLAPLVSWHKRFPLGQGLAEDQVWREVMAPELGALPGNVLGIWQFAFTEMLNNAIDHSSGTSVTIHLTKTAATSEVWIHDDGVGIFKKIQRALGLADERHAVLELAKGKFTTDPRQHSGEGIFFSSRLFDSFVILSGGVFFSHEFDKVEGWIVQARKDVPGTLVRMILNNHTARSARTVFDQFTVGEDYAFTKTVVPVKFMEYGDDNLVSRSQARRLLERFDRFKMVILDFTDVASIGQAFADEVFRVFQGNHPEVELSAIRANTAIKRMISRARALARENGD